MSSVDCERTESPYLANIPQILLALQALAVRSNHLPALSASGTSNIQHHGCRRWQCEAEPHNHRARSTPSADSSCESGLLTPARAHRESKASATNRTPSMPKSPRAGARIFTTYSATPRAGARIFTTYSATPRAGARIFTMHSAAQRARACYPKSGRTHIYDIFFENDHVPETL